MQTFSKRNKLNQEYSGHNKASENLRNRILLLYGLPYSGNEYHFGIGNDNWIHEVAFSKDLQLHFGRRIPIENFRDETLTTYDNLFDFVELYYQRALKDLDYTKRKRLLNEISQAFINSGSVYEFSEEGQVVLKIDDSIAENITKTDTILVPFEDAQRVFRDCVDGLVTRTKPPKNVVGDMSIVFEDYLKKSTSQSSIDKAIQYLKDKLSFHATQIQIIEKLKAYRGDVWGAAHAGNSPEPDERDALWYLESIVAQIRYIENKIKN